MTWRRAHWCSSACCRIPGPWAFHIRKSSTTPTPARPAGSGSCGNGTGSIAGPPVDHQRVTPQPRKTRLAAREVRPRAARWCPAARRQQRGPARSSPRSTNRSGARAPRDPLPALVGEAIRADRQDRLGHPAPAPGAAVIASISRRRIQIGHQVARAQRPTSSRASSWPRYDPPLRNPAPCSLARHSPARLPAARAADQRPPEPASGPAAVYLVFPAWLSGGPRPKTGCRNSSPCTAAVARMRMPFTVV